MSRSALLVMLSIATLLLAGCGHGAKADSDDVRYGAILTNLTPELAGLATTQNNNRGNSAVVGNINMRLFVDDWNRIWLMDRPSALSPYPTVSTSRDP